MNIKMLQLQSTHQLLKAHSGCYLDSFQLFMHNVFCRLAACISTLAIRLGYPGDIEKCFYYKLCLYAVRPVPYTCR